MGAFDDEARRLREEREEAARRAALPTPRQVWDAFVQDELDGLLAEFVVAAAAAKPSAAPLVRHQIGQHSGAYHREGAGEMESEWYEPDVCWYVTSDREVTRGSTVSTKAEWVTAFIPWQVNRNPPYKEVAGDAWTGLEPEDTRERLRQHYINHLKKWL